MTNKKEHRIDQYKEFCHMYISIRRRKENNHDGNEVCIRQIIYEDEEDMFRLKAKISRIPGVWRIYKTINKRSFESARKILMCKLIEQPENFKHQIDTKWRSILMTPACKAERKFLIDIDTKDLDTYQKITSIFEKQKIKKLNQIETPNGVHIVTDCFDTRLLKDIPDVEIKSDGYVFVEKIEVQ